MDYLVHLIIIIGIFSLLAMSLNLVVGHTGLLSITHAAFYGIGAYSTAILTTRYEMNFFLSLAAGIIFACLFAFLLGIILSRFSGDYYALVSLGFNTIVYSIFLNWKSATRGPLGIAGIPRPELGQITFSSNTAFLLLVFAAGIVVYLLSEYLAASPFGRVLHAIREDEQTTKVFGYHTEGYKLLIFIISAGCAAVAGSLYASYIMFISPQLFVVMESVFILAVIIFGGLASTRGAVWGTVFFLLIPEILRQAGFPDIIAAQMRQVVFGIVLVLVMMYRPRGLIGEYRL